MLIEQLLIVLLPAPGLVLVAPEDVEHALALAHRLGDTGKPRASHQLVDQLAKAGRVHTVQF
ncbi:hypothetical protein D3C75_1345030 [compost metagenome]